MQKVRKAVIPAAGHGTRFLPVTKAVPKEMLAIIDKPALHYIVKEAADSGIEEVLIVISPEKQMIGQYFGSGETECVAERELNELTRAVKFRCAVQRDAGGTGAAVMLARDFTGDEPFAVMYGDDVIVNDGGRPCLAQLIDAYERTGKSILGVQERPPEEAIKYAVVKKGRSEGRLTEVLGIIEKPATTEGLPSTLSSLGRYVLTPDIYPAIEQAPLFRGEKYLTHAVEKLIPKGVYACEFEGTRYDIGDKFGYVRANVEMGVRRFGDKMKDYLKELTRGF